jgi:23S rRNA-/tRNA-specific pseudouridylate synthase
MDFDTPLDVVYEDADVVAVNKPVGFHTAPIHRWQGGSIVSLLLAHFSRAAASTAAAAPGGSDGAPQQQQQQPSHVAAVKPYVVHRLDYNTSGLLLLGKRREVVPGISKQFRWAGSRCCVPCLSD